MHRSSGHSLAAAALMLGALLTASRPAAAGLHAPGHKAKAAIAANEGSWLVRAGAAQDLYANIGKHPLPLVVYLCTRPDGLAAPHVQLQILGRAPSISRAARASTCCWPPASGWRSSTRTPWA